MRPSKKLAFLSSLAGLLSLSAFASLNAFVRQESDHSTIRIRCLNPAGDERFVYESNDEDLRRVCVGEMNLLSSSEVDPVLIVNHDIPGLYLYQIVDKKSFQAAVTLEAHPAEMKSVEGDGQVVAWRTSFPATLRINPGLNPGKNSFNTDFQTIDFFKLPTATTAPGILATAALTATIQTKTASSEALTCTQETNTW